MRKNPQILIFTLFYFCFQEKNSTLSAVQIVQSFTKIKKDLIFLQNAGSGSVFNEYGSATML
jgi:hypothetical protein